MVIDISIGLKFLSNIGYQLRVRVRLQGLCGYSKKHI